MVKSVFRSMSVRITGVVVMLLPVMTGVVQGGENKEWMKAEKSRMPAAKVKGGQESSDGQKKGRHEADANGATTALQVIVTGVQRMVQVRVAEHQPWQNAKVGMELGPGVEFRTGPRSAVRFVIPPEQTVTLDRLGTIKVLEAIRQHNQKVKTDLGMQYGRTRYDISAAGFEYESKIYSPSLTLAVRGSWLTVQFDAFNSYAMGEGQLRFYNNLEHESMAFGRNVPAKVRPDRQSAPQVSQEESTIDAKGTFTGRTLAEQRLAQNDPGVGGNDYRSLVEAHRLPGRSPALKPSLHVPIKKGPLILTASWVNLAMGQADLNLSLINSMNQVVSGSSPILGEVPTQAVHLGNDPGRDGGGIEQIKFPLNFKHEPFRLIVQHDGDRGQVSAKLSLTGSIGPTAKTVINAKSILAPNQSFKAKIAP